MPGGSTVVTRGVPAPPPGETRDYFVAVDGGPILECTEDNNGAVVTGAACPAME